MPLDDITASRRIGGFVDTNDNDAPTTTTTSGGVPTTAAAAPAPPGPPAVAHRAAHHPHGMAANHYSHHHRQQQQAVYHQQQQRQQQLEQQKLHQQQQLSAMDVLSPEYELIDRIGEGNYGVVYRAKHRSTGRIVVIKRLKPLGLYRQFLREIAILQRVRHENCVNCIKTVPISSSGGKAELICEYCPLNVLQYQACFERPDSPLQTMNRRAALSYLAQSGARDPPGLVPMHHIQNILRCILKGLNHLHLQCILHRDLKPENILVNLLPDGESLDHEPIVAEFNELNNGIADLESFARRLSALPHRTIAKICDFGSARVSMPPCATVSSRRNTPHNIITVPYRAPEVLLEGFYHTPVDMWSIGCIFAELVTNEVLFPYQKSDDTHWGHLMTVMSMVGTPTPAEWDATCSPNIRGQLDPRHFPQFQRKLDNFAGGLLRSRLDDDGMSLLNALLTFVPDQRITAEEALQHPFFLRDYSNHPTASTRVAAAATAVQQESASPSDVADANVHASPNHMMPTPAAANTVAIDVAAAAANRVLRHSASSENVAATASGTTSPIPMVAAAAASTGGGGGPVSPSKRTMAARQAASSSSVAGPGALHAAAPTHQ